MWEGTPFPAFLLIKKVTKESDKLSKNKGSFRGDFYLIGKISCEIKKAAAPHTRDRQPALPPKLAPALYGNSPLISVNAGSTLYLAM